MSSIAEELAALTPEQRQLLELALKDKGIEVDKLQITPRVEKRDGYPLSYAQERLWFLAQLDPASPAYHIAAPMQLTGELDRPSLVAALRALVERHEALRTLFVLHGGEPAQTVQEGFVQPVPHIDLTGLQESVARQLQPRLVARVSSQPFDLSRGPLLRSVLVWLAARDHALLLNMHHIVSDGWSMGIFYRELWALYQAFTAGKASPLTALTLQYVDFALWQRGWLDERVLGEQLGYWRRQLEGAPPVLRLPIDRPRPPLQSFNGAGSALWISEALTTRARELARGEKSTLFVILLTLFQALLARVTGELDIVVGSPSAGRNREEIEPLIGFFINTLVLRTRFDEAPSLRTAIHQVREVVEGANAHNDLPFARLVAEVVPERSLDHSPIFQVDFAFQVAPAKGLVLEGLEARILSGENPSAQFDLSVTLTDREQTITGALVFNTDLFDATTIARLSRQFRILVSGALSEPNRPLEELPLLSDAERHQLSVEWNDTDEPALDRGLDGLTLVDLLARQAAETPDRIALSCDRRALTYGAFERRVVRRAADLRKRGVGPEAVVAVLANRTLEQLVAIHAIVRAGGAYLPLDPDYPREHIAFVLGDSGARWVMVEEELKDFLVLSSDGPAMQVLSLDKPFESEGGGPAGRAALPENSAYVIFTSGSTGKPKGVVNTHRAIVNRLLWMQDAYVLDASDRVLYKTPYSFDVSVWELFWPLSVGAELVIAQPGGHKDSAYLANQLSARRVTTVHFVPSMLKAFLDEPRLVSQARCESLRRVICSGEVLPRESSRRFFELFTRERSTEGPRLENLYGPTEAAIDVTRWPVGEAGLKEGLSLPIGRPIANLQIHLLDGHGEPVAIGVPAELLIAGSGLARGYLGRFALTAEKFVPHPRAGEPGARVYRSGDLVRRRGDGAIEFLGRLDHQVKVRGFRIELGEIEAVLAEAPGVSDATVITRRDGSGHQGLVAYLVAEESLVDKTVLDTSSLRSWLGEHLPEHMVPAIFVALDELPLTGSGKVDRKALPDPSAGRLGVGGEFAAPTGDLERRLSEIWRRLLEVDQVGAEDNFFDLGGHSLLLIRVREEVRKELAIELPVVDLFRYPTIRRLAERLGGGGATGNGDTAGAAASAQVAAGSARARQRLAGSRQGEDGARATPIAIVGMAGRFPQAPDLDTFWRNLRDGVEGVTFFDDEELAAAGVAPEILSHPDYVKAQAALDGQDFADAGLFGISAREAQLTDPQHRIFLECAWQALEHSGHTAESFDGAIGVYGGAGMTNYWVNLLSNPQLMQEIGLLAAMIGNNKDFLASRVSYKLNLEGPSFNVQTACSTSLVATHLACQALATGECDLALAGGVTVSGKSKTGYWYKEGGILSPDGHCRAFDADGAGVVASSGVGMVVLKRLEDARRDDDTIWAVIRGSAINNDGSNKVGFTAPSIEGQARAIAEAQTMAGIEPSTVQYIEAHGTATPLGDPIEVAALSEVFGRGPKKHCALGSVKTNIGHTDAASGIAGLIKAVLCLAHREIPPSLNFETPNPAIDFANSPFYVATELADWPAKEAHPRRAGVSSFGLGGTNAHVVLEEAPTRAVAEAVEGDDGSTQDWHIMVLSAATGSALEALTDRLAESLAEPGPKLVDVAHTCQVGRRRLAFRRALLCRDRAGAATALASRDPARLLEASNSYSGRPVAFLLPGVGDQYPGMAAQLYREMPVFRGAIDRCAEILQPLLGEDLRSVIFAESVPSHEEGEAGGTGGAGGLDLRAMVGRGEAGGGRAVGKAAARLRQTRLAQPAVFAIDYALAQLWIDWGIVPRALVGYSLGEYVAASLAGVLSLEDALTLVAERAALIDVLPPGAMLALPMAARDAAAYLDDEVVLAASNAPLVSVVAGPPVAIEGLEERLKTAGIVSQRLVTSHAFHSPMMRPAARALTERVSKLTLRPPRIPYLSNVTGEWITAEQATDPGYWADHLCATVRFAESLARLMENPDQVLLEVGPGVALSTSARQNEAATAEQLVLSSLRDEREERSDLAFLFESLARLWLAGVDVDWTRFSRRQGGRRVPLPTYPFERQSYWLEPFGGRATAAPARRGGRLNDLSQWFHLPQWRPTPPASVEKLSQRVGGRWLLIADRGGLADRLAARLRQLGADCDLARMGAEGARGDHSIDGSNPEAWSALIGRLQGEDKVPAKIVHLAALNAAEAPAAGADSMLAAQEEGLLAVVGLSRALTGAGITADLRLAVVAKGLHGSGETGEGRPEHGTIVGALRAIPQEYRNFECLTVDLDLARPVELTATTLDRLLADLAGCAARNLTYRRSGRFELEYRAVALGEEASGASPFQHGGRYLITGGFGLVGRTLARWLASEYGARLVLVSRSEMPVAEVWDRWLADHPEADPTSRRIALLREIAALGGQAEAMAADVADRSAMTAAVARSVERFGGLDGVIHLAGATAQSEIHTPLEGTDREVCKRQLTSKAVGCAILEEVVEGLDLDFVVLFSSMSSLLGGLGFTAYAAANSFLDAFAAARYSRGGTPWIALNWDGWREPEEEVSAGAISMSPEEATEALRRALQMLPAAQVVISVGELDARLSRWVRFDQDRKGERADGEEAEENGAGAVYARPAHLQNPYVAPTTETEVTIGKLWGRMLGIEEVGVHDNFFQLGGDSLLATQLASRMREALKKDFPLQLFFTSPTVAQMSVALDADTEAAEEQSELEAILREVRGLSFEELASELEAETESTDSADSGESESR